MQMAHTLTASCSLSAKAQHSTAHLVYSRPTTHDPWADGQAVSYCSAAVECLCWQELFDSHVLVAHIHSAICSDLQQHTPAHTSQVLGPLKREDTGSHAHLGLKHSKLTHQQPKSAQANVAARQQSTPRHHQQQQAHPPAWTGWLHCSSWS